MTSKKLVKTETSNETYIVPVVDVYENSNAYELLFEMPGVEKENFDITIDNNELEVRGKVKAVNDDKELKYSEFNLYNYYRKFNLGNDINRDNISAEFENGVLILKVQKSEDVKPKKIEVTVN